MDCQLGDPHLVAGDHRPCGEEQPTGVLTDRRLQGGLELVGGACAHELQLETQGVEKLDPNASYVLVANHRSYMDIPAVLAAIPLEIRFFAKRGLFQIPFLGTHLRRAGHLPVVRGDARASLKTLQEAAHRLRREGITPLLFPSLLLSEVR